MVEMDVEHAFGAARRGRERRLRQFPRQEPLTVAVVLAPRVAAPHRSMRTEKFQGWGGGEQDARSSTETEDSSSPGGTEFSKLSAAVPLVLVEWPQGGMRGDRAITARTSRQRRAWWVSPMTLLSTSPPSIRAEEQMKKREREK